MVEPKMVTRWEDNSGILHDTEEECRTANFMIEHQGWVNNFMEDVRWTADIYELKDVLFNYEDVILKVMNWEKK